jgi:uncharacterized protein
VAVERIDQCNRCSFEGKVERGVFMQRELRRKDRAIDAEEALELLQRGEYGVLSTVSADGAPYGVPVSYCVIDGAIYFHCAVQGRKLENLAADARVSFCVVGATEVLPDLFATRYESVVVSGKAQEVYGAQKQRALEGLVAKYSSDFQEQGKQYIDSKAQRTRVFMISVSSICGKARS